MNRGSFNIAPERLVGSRMYMLLKMIALVQKMVLDVRQTFMIATLARNDVQSVFE